MKSWSHRALADDTEIASTYEKTKSTGQRHNRSSKCSLALITAAQRRAADQLDRSRSSAAPRSWSAALNRFASNLPFQHVGNLMQFVCNLCAFRPTWSWLQRRTNDTELKISVHARHTRHGAQMSRGKSQQRDRKAERRPLDLCKWMYVWMRTAEITQNTLGLNVWQLLWHFPEFVVLTSLKKAKWPWSEVSLSVLMLDLFSLSSDLTLQWHNTCSNCELQ